MTTDDVDQRYDRDFLLSAEKRNQLVELWEVEKYGRDCFNDPDHVHLYGMAPKDWYERGVRILARTCLEAVNDPLGNKIGSDIAEVVTTSAGNRKIGAKTPQRFYVLRGSIRSLLTANRLSSFCPHRPLAH